MLDEDGPEEDRVSIVGEELLVVGHFFAFVLRRTFRTGRFRSGCTGSLVIPVVQGGGSLAGKLASRIASISSSVGLTAESGLPLRGRGTRAGRTDLVAIALRSRSLRREAIHAIADG